MIIEEGVHAKQTNDPMNCPTISGVPKSNTGQHNHRRRHTLVFGHSQRQLLWFIHHESIEQILDHVFVHSADLSVAQLTVNLQHFTTEHPRLVQMGCQTELLLCSFMESTPAALPPAPRGLGCQFGGSVQKEMKKTGGLD